MKDKTGLFRLWQQFTDNSDWPENWSEIPTRELGPCDALVLQKEICFLDFETAGLKPAEGFTWCYWLVSWSPDSGWRRAWQQRHELDAGPGNIGDNLIKPCLDQCIVVAANIGFERAWLSHRSTRDTNLYIDIRSLVSAVFAPGDAGSLAEIAMKVLGVKLDKGVRDNIVAAGTNYNLMLWPETKNYCWLDVEVMVQVWRNLQADYVFRIPHPVSRFGSLLASTLKTPVKGLAKIQANCALEHGALRELAFTAIQEKAIVLAKECPSWVCSCPRKQEEKSVWLSNCAEELARSDTMQGLYPGFPSSEPEHMPVTAGIVAAVRKKLLGWVNGTTESLADEFTAVLVGASYHFGTSSNHQSLLAKTNEGWFYQNGKGESVALLDKDGKPVKGNTPFGNSVPVFDAQVDAPGIVCQVPQLQTYLNMTSFYRSIKTRLKKAVEDTQETAKESDDGWIYPSPTINGTFTGRSIDPFWLVLANPKPQKLASEIKIAVSAKPGHKLVRYDFSSQELRIAHYISSAYGYKNWNWLPKYENNEFAVSETSGDKSKGTDSHSLFAKKITDISGVETSRDIAKNCAYACVPMHTEALSKDRGWVKYHELNIGDIILTHNTETGLNEWQPVLALTKLEGKKTIIWSDSDVTIESTPDHRWYGSRRIKTGNSPTSFTYIKPEFFTTEQRSTEHRILVVAPTLETNKGGNFNNLINKYDNDCDWVKLVLGMSTAERWLFFNRANFSQEYTKQPGLFDAVCLCGYLLGYRVSARQNDKRKESNKLMMKTVGFGNTQYKTLTNKIAVTEGEHQEVWCPTTCNGTWVMRQNEFITITGNCQFGVGIKGLMVQSKLPEQVAEATMTAYKGEQRWAEKDEGGFLEYRGGVLSGFFNYAATVNAPNARSLCYGRRPHLTPWPPTRLTLQNFPVQGTGVDMRDTLLVYLFCGLQVADLEHLTWAEVCAVLLHDEQVFHVPDVDVDAFCGVLADAHRKAWQKLSECVFSRVGGYSGQADAPESHMVLEGFEVYGHWRKEVDMAIKTPTCDLPANWDNGYLWK